MIYGYARCSTNETKQDIDRQIRELKSAGAEIVFNEYEHGDTESKAELEKLFEIVVEGDTIVTTEVSRLSRSTQHLCAIINRINEKKLRLVIIGSITIDCRNGKIDPMSNAFIQMAGVFAELELAMYRARVRSGIENARAKGKKLGRPVTTADAIPEVFFRYYPQFKAANINKAEFSKLTSLSRPTINKYIALVEARAER